jgi:hypothetical protein
MPDTFAREEAPGGAGWRSGAADAGTGEASYRSGTAVDTGMVAALPPALASGVGPPPRASSFQGLTRETAASPAGRVGLATSFIGTGSRDPLYNRGDLVSSHHGGTAPRGSRSPRGSGSPRRQVPGRRPEPSPSPRSLVLRERSTTEHLVHHHGDAGRDDDDAPHNDRHAVRGGRVVHLGTDDSSSDDGGRARRTDGGVGTDEGVQWCGVCEQMQRELRRASDLLATTEVVRLEHKVDTHRRVARLQAALSLSTAKARGSVLCAGTPRQVARRVLGLWRALAGRGAHVRARSAAKAAHMGARRSWRLATRGFYAWQRHCGRLMVEAEKTWQSVVTADKWPPGDKQHLEATGSPEEAVPARQAQSPSPTRLAVVDAFQFHAAGEDGEGNRAYAVDGGRCRGMGAGGGGGAWLGGCGDATWRQSHGGGGAGAPRRQQQSGPTSSYAWEAELLRQHSGTVDELADELQARAAELLGDVRRRLAPSGVSIMGPDGRAVALGRPAGVGPSGRADTLRRGRWSDGAAESPLPSFPTREPGGWRARGGGTQPVEAADAPVDADQLFELLDADGDGVVTKAELAAALRCGPVAEESAYVCRVADARNRGAAAAAAGARELEHGMPPHAAAHAAGDTTANDYHCLTRLGAEFTPERRFSRRVNT